MISQTPAVRIVDALCDHTAPDLRALAKSLGVVAGKSKTKSDYAEAIRADLMDRRSLSETLERLDAGSRDALALAAHDPSGRFDEDAFVARHGRRPDWGTYRERRREREPSCFPEQPSLLWCLMPKRRGVPAELCPLLRELLPVPAQPALSTTAPLPAMVERRSTGNVKDGARRRVRLTVCERELAAQEELQAMLGLIDIEVLRISDETWRSSQEQEMAAAVLPALVGKADYYPLKRNGPVRASAWPMLLDAGMRSVKASSGELSFSSRGRRAMATHPAQTLRALWRSWLATSRYDELQSTGAYADDENDPDRGAVLNDPVERRRQVARALARCPQGEWVAVDELLRFMRSAGLRFHVSDELWTLQVCEFTDDGSFADYGPDGAYALEVTYTLCVLFQFASTLGMIDVAYASPEHLREFGGFVAPDHYLSVYDGLCFIRLTALGSYCLGLADDYEVPQAPAPTLTISRDLVISAPGAAGAERLILDRYAKSLGADVWQISREALLCALQAGAAPAQLHDLLARSGAEVPDALHELSDDVAARLLRLRGNAQLFDCASAERLDGLLQDSQIRRLATRCGERTLAVLLADVPEFRSRLRALDYVAESAH